MADKIHKLRVRRRGAKGKRREQLTKQIQALRPKPKAPEPPITASLGPKDIRREINTATDLKYGEEERTLGAQRRASDRFQRQVPEYFSDYQKQIAALRGQADQAAKSEQEALTKRTEQTSIAEEAARKAVSQAEAAQAARVQGVVPSPTPDQQAQAASSSRRTAQDTFQSLLGAQRQAQQGFETARSIGGMREEARRLEGEGRYKRGIEQKQINLAKDKGSFKQGYRSELRESERKWLLDKAAASAAGDESIAKAEAADVQNQRYRSLAKYKSKLSQQTIKRQSDLNTALQNLKAKNRNEYLDLTQGGGSGSKKKDTRGNNDTHAAYSTIKNIIRKERAAGKDVHPRLFGRDRRSGKEVRRAVRDKLVSDFGYSRWAAQQAVNAIYLNKKL